MSIAEYCKGKKECFVTENGLLSWTIEGKTEAEDKVLSDRFSTIQVLVIVSEEYRRRIFKKVR